ncbi:MAG: SPOR domain-containing protein [Candidatus Omnitrophota bacterium]|nr:SPOR domain-containing protein [Candidatus Omnitrophota bacterium]
MIEKEYGQLELFSQTKGQNQANAGLSKAFISYISKYEKAILIIIGFVITGIVSFSLGVEKGKNFILLKTASHLDIAAKPEPSLSVSAPKQITKEQQYQPEKKDELKEYIQNYTIQVASFLNRVNAQKEANILKRKGLSPLVLSKGKFSIVCVGNFAKREEAESLLSKLKKQYQDCRIRRL